MAADFAKRRGRIDAAINNAAFLKYEPLETVTEETVDRMLGAGFKSAIWGPIAPGGRDAVCCPGARPALSVGAAPRYKGLARGG